MTQQPNRNIAPEIESIQSVKILEPTIYTLSNGVPVAVFDSPNQDLLKIDVVFEAGTKASQKPWIANTVNNMLTEVTKNYSATALAEEIDFYGAYFDTHAARDFASVSLYSLNGFLENTLPLLAEVIQNASFNQEELEDYKLRKKQEFKVNSEKVSFLARQVFTSLLFGKDHPYGKYSKLEDIDLITRQDLIDFHQKYYVSSSFKIYVAGKFGQNELDLLNKYMGSMAAIQLELNDQIDWTINESSEKKTHISKENAVQNALRLGLVTVHKNHPDYFGMKILTTILGGYFGSRLMNNIREDKGYTYGIGSSLSSFQNETVFFISTEVNSDVSQLAIEEILKEIKILQTELIDDNELLIVKNYLQGSFQRSFDGTFNLLDRFKEVDLNQADYSYYQNYISKVKTIDALELRKLAQKHLQLDKIFLLSVGN